jgi:hypothetical protein
MQFKKESGIRSADHLANLCAVIAKGAHRVTVKSRQSQWTLATEVDAQRMSRTNHLSRPGTQVVCRVNGNIMPFRFCSHAMSETGEQ